MKNFMKANFLLCGLAMVMLAVSFLACDDDQKDPPVEDTAKDQSANITPFEGKTIIVKGTFTNAEWGSGTTSVPNKINKEIQDLSELLPEGPARDDLKSRVQKCTVIKVEKTTEYAKWKTVTGDSTIYINYYVIGTAGFQTVINDVFESLNLNATAHE